MFPAPPSPKIEIHNPLVKRVEELETKLARLLQGEDACEKTSTGISKAEAIKMVEKRPLLSWANLHLNESFANHLKPQLGIVPFHWIFGVAKTDYDSRIVLLNLVDLSTISTVQWDRLIDAYLGDAPTMVAYIRGKQQSTPQDRKHAPNAERMQFTKAVFDLRRELEAKMLAYDVYGKKHLCAWSDREWRSYVDLMTFLKQSDLAKKLRLFEHVRLNGNDVAEFIYHRAHPRRFLNVSRVCVASNVQWKECHYEALNFVDWFPSVTTKTCLHLINTCNKQGWHELSSRLHVVLDIKDPWLYATGRKIQKARPRGTAI